MNRTEFVMFVFQIRRPDVVETILADGTHVVRSERPRVREVERQIVEMPREAAP